jgi:pimeloyl-ACP methyl ester carboxylesterase
MKIKSLFFFAVVLFANLQSTSQDTKKFRGTWEGKLTETLRIVVHVKTDANGNLLSSLDSPDQAVFGIPADKTTINGNQLTFEVTKLNASYSGQLINDSTIDGNLRQGAATPLVLNKKREDTEQSDKKTFSNNSNYKNIDVSVKIDHLTLSGTIFQPLNTKSFPIVLIIAGSGPTDRDGNTILLPGKNNSLLQLADSLAQHGIATLRYDKRGIGKSIPDTRMREEEITIDVIANDAKAMYEWLKTNGYNSIFIAGHSEGSLIGLMISEKLRPQGFISIAGAGRKGGDILREQLAGQLPAQLKTEFDNDLDSLERGLSVSTVNTSLMGLMRPSVQPYVKSWLKLDPQNLIRQLNCPILIVQGTRDLQIKEIDAQKLYQANPASKLVMIKNMNHVFKQLESDKTDDNIKAYSDPNLPVSKELITTITNFIQSTR